MNAKFKATRIADWQALAPMAEVRALVRELML